MDYNKLLALYKTKFQSSPRAFRSPGRINIIGEHTDYNEGFVLPAAVDKEIGLLMGESSSDHFTIYSVDNDEHVSFTIKNYKEVKEDWAQYMIGIIDQLQKNNYKVKPIDCVFSGDIPMGAGMSSSAALECATLFAFNEVFELDIEKPLIAKMAQKAENEYVGVNCGIMDQFASVMSQIDHAIKLDCRDLSYEPFSIDLSGYRFVLIDTMVKHSLASSEYNVRRRECEEGVSILKKYNSKINSLRDADLELLNAHKTEMSASVYMRCFYVISEIERVTQACKAMEGNDMTQLGILLYKTHQGLQYYYEVSCDELDFLVDFTRDKEKVLGARMMGGGFGGCTINLVAESYVDELTSAVKEAYQKEFSKEPLVYVVQTAAGSSEVTKEIMEHG